MNHLDEGKIHAWIDGAFDAARSREIEAHVAQCASCSAAVAEARGLVAGASRILNALDDVPAGVLPKGVVPTGVVAKAARAALPARGRWRTTAWVGGGGLAAAAALLLAVVLRDPAAKSIEQLMVADSAVPAAGAARFEVSIPPQAPATTPLASAVGAVSGAPSADGRAVAPRVVATAKRADDAPRQVAAVVEEARGDTTAPQRETALGKSVAAAPPQAALNEVVVGAPARDRAAASSQRSEEKRAALVPVTPLRDLAADRVEADSARVTGFAGCYRVEASKLRAMSAATLGAVVEGVRRRAAAPTAAPSEAAARAGFAPSPSAMVRLDTALTPTGYRVFAFPSDSTVGTWREVRRDSAVVDLLARGVFTFARKDRQVCPQP